MYGIAFGLASGLLVIVGAESLRMMRELTMEELVAERRQASSAIKERVGPFTRFVDLLGSYSQKALQGVYGEGRVRKLAWRLRVAGRPAGLTTHTFLQREAGFVTVGVIVLLLGALNDYMVLGVGLFFLFSLWMHVWLLIVIRQRQGEIERDLPDFLDVFAVTVAAGLPFRPALRRVADEHNGALAEEIGWALREMQFGVPRRSALEGIRDRTPSDNVSAFVTALLQAEELGTPLEEALRQIAKEIRRAHAQQSRRAATRAQPKVSLVVTLLMVPGAIVLLGGSMLVTTFSGLPNGFGG